MIAGLPVLVSGMIGMKEEESIGKSRYFVIRKFQVFL